MSDEPVDARRVAGLDGLGGHDGGGAGRPAAADLGRLGEPDAGPDAGAVAPVADLFGTTGASGSPESGVGKSGVADLGDTVDADGLGAERSDVTVAELGPGAARRSGRGRPRRGSRQGRAGDPGTAPSEPGRSGRSGTGTRDRPRVVPAHPAEEPHPEPGSTDGADTGTGSRTRGRQGRGPAQIDPDADPVEAARAICLRLLTDRARTRKELAQALRRRGVPDEAAHTVLERFDEVGLIDDAAFAGQWARSRHSHRGLARRAIAMELRRKGVSDTDAVDALAGVDDESEERRARELVDRKLRSVAVGTAEQRATAGRRLVGMLARKGYGAGTAYRVVKEALAEAGAEADELADAEVPVSDE